MNNKECLDYIQKTFSETTNKNKEIIALELGEKYANKIESKYWSLDYKSVVENKEHFDFIADIILDKESNADAFSFTKKYMSGDLTSTNVRIFIHRDVGADFYIFTSPTDKNFVGWFFAVK